MRHVLEREYGHDVPSYIGDYDSAEDSTSTHRAIRRALGDGRWQKVRADDAREGDVALLWLRDPRRPSHIGIRVGPSDVLLHTRLATGVIVERLDGVLGQRVLGWWRWEAAALDALDQTPRDPVSIVAILTTIASAIPGASAIAGGVSALLGAGGLATAGVALGSLSGFGLFVAGATQVVAIGAAIAGFGLASRALRPDAPEGGGVGGLSPTLLGIGNNAQPGQVVPEVFGTHRLFPPAIGWYTEPGSDWLRILLAVGMGPVEMSAIHVGETPIGDLDGAEIEVRNGETTDAPLRGFSDNIIQSVPNIRYPMGIEDDPNHVPPVPVSDWSSATTAPDTERIGVGLHFPAGMYTFRKSGGTSIMWVRFDLEYREHGTAAWQPVPPLPAELPQVPSSASYLLPRIDRRRHPQDPEAGDADRIDGEPPICVRRGAAHEGARKPLEAGLDPHPRLPESDRVGGPQGALRRAPAPPRGRYRRPVRRPSPGERVRLVCLALLQSRPRSRPSTPPCSRAPAAWPRWRCACASPIRSRARSTASASRSRASSGPTIPTRPIPLRRTRAPASGRAGPPSPWRPAAPPPPGATCGSGCCPSRSAPRRSTSARSTPGPRGVTPTSTDSTASSTTSRSLRTSRVRSPAPAAPICTSAAAASP